MAFVALGACGRFGFENVDSQALSLPSVLQDGGAGQLQSGLDPSLLPDGGIGPGCSVGTLANCSACGDDCSTQSLPGVAEFACVSAACTIGSCAPGYADCDHDPRNGCEVSLTTLTDCGGCGIACAIPNAEASCATGSCALVACSPGFGDCDSDLPTNGCERPLNTLTNCGGCGVPCTAANGTTSCDSGICQLSSCDNGFDNCDTDDRNGCETRLNLLTDCGTCGTPCTVSGGQDPNCSGGVCSAASCVPFFADCDGDGTSCETDLRTLSDCVSCNVPCGDPSGRLQNATASCASGSCGVGSCDPGWDNCDGSPGNGCETPLNTSIDCGGCGVPCARANATSSCASGSCVTVGCASGYDNCDGDDSNGCEALIGSHDYCSSCNDACDVNAICSGGSCVGQFVNYTPSNIDLGSLNAGNAPHLSLDCGSVVTLDTGSLATNGWCGHPAPPLIVQARTNGPDLLVIPLRSLDIAAGTTLRVKGSRALAFAVFGDVNIAGTLDVGAQGTNGGAGNEWNCASSLGTNGNGTSTGGGGGGGGGAFRANGGNGGPSNGGGGGGGGAPRSSDLLSPIVPGCNGGWGGGCGAGPGGGGGALDLAATGDLTVTGSILSRGGDGADGCGTAGGASGGGSGGAILLQANRVVTSGTLLADGGRGGRGSQGGAAGGGSATGAGQAGGGGGSRGGGGGGGSAGRIRIFGAQNCALGGTSSPAPSSSCP